MGDGLIHKINSEVCPPDKFDHRIDFGIPDNELSNRLEEILTVLKRIDRRKEEVVCYIKRREDGKYNIHTYFPQI